MYHAERTKKRNTENKSNSRLLKKDPLENQKFVQTPISDSLHFKCSLKKPPLNLTLHLILIGQTKSLDSKWTTNGFEKPIRTYPVKK